MERPSQIQRRILAIIALPVAALLAVTLVFLLLVRELNERARWVEHSDLVLSRASDAMRGMIDEETSIRAFLLRAEPRFLEPYRKAGVVPILEELDGLTTDNGAQHERVAALRAAYERCHERFERIVSGTVSLDEGIATVDEGKIRMDAARDIYEGLVAEEQRLRDERHQRAESQQRVLIGVVVGIFLFFSVLGVALSYRQIGQLTGIYQANVDQLEGAVSTLQREEQFRQTFLGVLGHDLRNPLAAVRMSAQLLSRAKLVAAPRRAVDRIVGSAERMERMITQILDITRARVGGGLGVNRRASDVPAMVRRMVDEALTSHPERTVTVEAPASLEFSLDVDRLEQVLANLLGNALTHGSPDHPVAVLVVREEGALVVSIHNDGPPIDEAFLPLLFDPFRRGASDRRELSSGLGLGLYICREIVRAHGGTLEVSSTVTQGTTFTIQIPPPTIDGAYA